MLQIHHDRNQTKTYLLGILVLAFFLRIMFLKTIPNGFFCDEASNAYDAYAILTTWRDQHGTFLPLFARALDDYRESLYIFITVPFIKVFGLNEFAARLPAALVGVLTVLFLYCLVKEWFNQRVALTASLFGSDLKERMNEVPS